jgi:hypothetical protein
MKLRGVTIFILIAHKQMEKDVMYTHPSPFIHSFINGTTSLRWVLASSSVS